MSLGTKLSQWIRRFGLAAACLILPWVMPNTWPAQVLMPWQKGYLSFSYEFARSDDTTSAKTKSSAAMPYSERVLTPDSLVVAHLTARTPFTIWTGYLMLLGFFIIAFSGHIIVSRKGWVAFSLATAMYGFASYALIFLASPQGPFDFELSLWSNLLDKADREVPWTYLALQGGTGQPLCRYGNFSSLSAGSRLV
jgi:hypothetical protein